MKHTQIYYEMWPFLTTSLHFLFLFLHVHPPKLIVVEGEPWRGREWNFSWATWNVRTGNNAKSYRRAEIFLIRKNLNFCNNLGFSAMRFFTEGMSYLLQTLNTRRGYKGVLSQFQSTKCYGSHKKLASESKSILLLNSYVTKHSQLTWFP